MHPADLLEHLLSTGIRICNPVLEDLRALEQAAADTSDEALAEDLLETVLWTVRAYLPEHSEED